MVLIKKFFNILLYFFLFAFNLIGGILNVYLFNNRLSPDKYIFLVFCFFSFAAAAIFLYRTIIKYIDFHKFFSNEVLGRKV
jgi:hypothetical protein